MKASIVSLLICFLCLASCTQAPSDQDMARKVFEALQKGDTLSLKEEFVKSEEFVAVINKSEWSESKKESIRKRMTDQNIQEYLSANRKRLQQEAEMYKLNWSEAKVDSISVDNKIQEGIDVSEYKVHFTSGKSGYTLTLRDCMLTPRGRKISNGINLYKKED